MVDILLATYNGALYLEEQVESLLGQDFSDWRLLVRDDGSSDRTGAILEAYRKRCGARMVIIPGCGRSLGARGNFHELLRHSDARYAMFCDQDDVWLPEKISASLDKMREMEVRYGAQRALLVHADFKVVDERLRLIAGSGWRYQKSDPNRSSLNRLLVQNVATGCSMMLNAPLRELALPIPERAVMHDWWVALVAAGLGEIGCLAKPLLLYRQHGDNAVGARGWSARSFIKQLGRVGELRAELRRAQEQGAAFLDAYGDRLSGREGESTQAFSRLAAAGCFRKRYHLVKYGLFHAGLLRKTGMFLFC